MNQNPGQGQQAAPQQGYAYPQQGYPVMNNPGQNYNPYGQMGRQTAAQQVQTQVPLNTSGYVPPPVPVRKAPFTLDNINLIIVCALMVILFAVGMFVPDFGVLKWVFIAFSVISIALFWI